MAKSMAVSVALLPQLKRPLGVDFEGVATENVIERASNVSDMMTTGNDDLRHESKDSAKVMNMPAPGQL